MPTNKNTIQIYGYSDDTVEVSSSNPDFCSDCYYTNTTAVVFCDPTGDIFRIKYTDSGVWRITHETVSGLLEVSIAPAPENDDNNYTDRATVSGPITKVFVASAWPIPAHELKLRCEYHMDQGLTHSEWLMVWAALGKP